MTIQCPKCGTKINAAKLLGAKGGSTTGATKARDPEKMRQAALKRWSDIKAKVEASTATREQFETKASALDKKVGKIAKRCAKKKKVGK